jgi:hypothetical protein
VADAPDTIVLRQHRDLAGRGYEAWIRRVLLLLLVAVLVVGLLNVFGQRASTTIADAAAARLKVSAPAQVRGGLIYQARIHVTARHELKDAQLVLSSEWVDGITVNTIEPSPVGEASRNGNLALDLGHIPAHDDYLLFMEFQVNPTTIGHRHPTVDLYDGGTRVLHLRRTLTIFP